MGIQGLLPLLKECQRAAHIQEYKVCCLLLSSTQVALLYAADCLLSTFRCNSKLLDHVLGRPQSAQGQTLGIDAYVWLHRGAYGCAEVRPSMDLVSLVRMLTGPRTVPSGTRDWQADRKV